MPAEVEDVHVITGLEMGGAERTLERLLAELRTTRSAAVISLADRGRLGAAIEAGGTPIFALGLRPEIPSPSALLRLRRLLGQLRPRTVQGWMYHGNLAASLGAVSGRKGRPTVLWNVRQSLGDIAREKPLTRLVIKAGARMSWSADAIIYNSQVSASQHEALGYSAAKTLVIPNGIDVSQFRPDPERRTVVRRRLGVEDGELVIGFVARFHPMKGHIPFLRVLAAGPLGEMSYRVVMAGTGVDHTNRELGLALRDTGLVERTTLLGELATPEELYPGLDLLCLPSLWGEGCPNVVLEAMACGIPCVVTDVGDSAAVVGDRNLVVPPGDPAALGAAMAAVASLSPGQRAALGARLRRRIETVYSLGTMVARYQAIYEHGAAGGGA